MRTMYDSVTVANIPADATLIAGYVNGTYTNVAQLRARFPGATVVGISVTAQFNAGTVLDVERYDATPDEAPDWVLMRRAAGIDPSVYCSLDAWPAVRDAFVQRHLPEPWYWIAAYDDVAEIPAGAVAKQYRDAGPYDISVVADHWPGVDIPQGDIVLDTATLQQIVTAVWAHDETNALTGQPVRMGAVLAWEDDVHAKLEKQSADIAKALQGINSVLVEILAVLPKAAGAPLAAAIAETVSGTVADSLTAGGYTPPSA